MFAPWNSCPCTVYIVTDSFSPTPARVRSTANPSGPPENSVADGHTSDGESEWGWTRRHQLGIGIMAAVCLFFLVIQIARRPVYWNNRVQVTPAPQVPPPPAVQRTLNPNTADFASLVRLAGVGPSRATALLNWRTQQQKLHPGKPVFQKLADLRHIRGFGPVTLRHIAPFLRFDVSTAQKNRPPVTGPFTAAASQR